MAERLLEGEQNAHELFRQLTDLQSTDREEITSQLLATKEQLDTIFFNDPTARRYAAAMVEGIAWQYWGEPGQYLPGNFIMAKDGMRELFGANGYIRRQIIEAFVPIVENAQAKFLRQALRPNQHEKVEAICEVLRQSPIHALLTSFLEDPGMQERPLATLEKISEYAAIHDQVRQKYQLTRAELEGSIFAGSDQSRVFAARRELQQQHARLDERTRPIRRERAVADPLLRARHFFAHQFLGGQLDSYNIKNIFIDTGELAYNEGEELGDFQLGYIQDLIAETFMMREEDQLENRFAYDVMTRLFEPNLDELKLTPETIEYMTKGFANWAWDEYVHIQAGKYDIWKGTGSTTKLQPLFWLRRVRSPLQQEHDGSLVYAVPDDTFGQFPLLDREQYRKLAREKVGRIILDKRPLSEKYAKPPRMLMGEPGTTLDGELQQRGEPRIGLRITPKAYQTTCGNRLPHIPGYDLVQFERGEDWYNLSFTESSEGDPYGYCPVELDERAKDAVLRIAHQRKLRVLAKAIEAREQLTVGELARMISGFSRYYVPSKAFGGRTLKVANGYAYMQCNGAANLLVEMLNAGFGAQVAQEIGGKPLSPILTGVDHSQVLFRYQEYYYLLDATPGSSGAELGVRLFLGELGRSALQLLRGHGSAKRRPRGKAPLAQKIEEALPQDTGEQESIPPKPITYYFTDIRSAFERQVRVRERLENTPRSKLWQHVVTHYKKPGDPLYLTATHILQAAPRAVPADITELSVENIAKRQERLHETIAYLERLDTAPLVVRAKYTSHKDLRPFIDLLQQLKTEYVRLAAHKT